MDSLDSVRSLFSARVERRGGEYVIEVPRNEVDLGAVDTDAVYRVGLLEALDRDEDTRDRSGRSTAADVDRSTGSRNRQSADDPTRSEPARPVREGDVVAVTIDDVGDEGDGIARIGAGYVLFVSDAAPGDTVAVEVTAVRDTYAFGDVVGDVSVDGERASPTA